jgi:hypothetical protein
MLHLDFYFKFGFFNELQFFMLIYNGMFFYLTFTNI